MFEGTCALRGPAEILLISRDTCNDRIAKIFRSCCFSDSVSTGVWCIPGFGAGFEIALELSKLQKEGEKPGKGHFYFLRQTLVCSKPWFKRDLSFYGVSHNYRAICSKTSIAHMCLCKTNYQGGWVSHHFGGAPTSLKKYRAICAHGIRRRRFLIFLGKK